MIEPKKNNKYYINFVDILIKIKFHCDFKIYLTKINNFKNFKNLFDD